MQAKVFLPLIFQALVARSIPLFDSIGAISFQGEKSLPAVYNWTADYVPDYTIHRSCNATQRHELQRGLDDSVKVAKHAREHILVHGKESPIYKKYFGNGPTGAVTGWYDKIATANRKGVIFRCDDPDKNCQTQNQWHGHYRGKNASMETVICDLSFFNRLPLEALCARGYDVVNGNAYSYWGFDIIHRLYHVDAIGDHAITHTTHGYKEAIELAAGENYAAAATNTDSLIYFASEAYAFDISVPGEGCAGKESSHFTDSHHLAKASVVSHTKVIPSEINPEAAALDDADNVEAAASDDADIVAAASNDAKTAVGSNCHTHDDGVVHCV